MLVPCWQLSCPGAAAVCALPAGSHAALHAGDSCILDLEVVKESHCDMDSATLYPVNAACNRALRLVQTEVGRAGPLCIEVVAPLADWALLCARKHWTAVACNVCLSPDMATNRLTATCCPAHIIIMNMTVFRSS